MSAITAVPSFFHNEYFIKKANAAPRINEANIDLTGFSPGQRFPQVINIFLYGGPSELAGNLTNIDDINANSQNKYPDNLVGATPTRITSNGFWGARVINGNTGDLQDLSAGGYIMEDMIRTDDMTVYRTINRRKNNTRAHRPSILSSQKGNLDIEMSGGTGTTIAGVLYNNRAMLDGHDVIGGKTLEELLLPFVSFEGTSSAFAPDANYSVPLTQFKGISLDTNFNNPFERSPGIGDDLILEALADKVSPKTSSRFARVNEGFINRKTLDEELVNISDGTLPAIPLGHPDRGPADEYVDASGILVYPNNGFTSRIKAAVTLAVNNPDSLYITVGGGLGGWDDHDNSITKYEDRMRALMDVMRAAMKHIRHATRPGAHAGIPTDNIIINIHGDFGRNVNLNGSMGWDHGNNQNLYTFGGSGIRPGTLGKIVGETERFGDSGQNRQFTRPTSSSYEVEPMSIASTVYSYFGVQNPEVLTSDPDMNPGGDPAIDETEAINAPEPVQMPQVPV